MEEELIISMLLSSSSSSSSSDFSMLFETSSDEEDFFKASVNIFKRQKQYRVQNFVDDVKNYSEEEFRRNFRISRKVTDLLIQLYKNSSHYKIKLFGGRNGISAESQCLAFLWFAANHESYREVANLFNVTQSAAHRHLTNFLEFIFEISTNYIKFPSTEEEKVEKANEFKQLAGFPNVIGCIDGSYIYIRKPANKVRSTYVNRQGLISLTLQGICDANMKFTDVYIGPSNNSHDYKIYELSPISKNIQTICGQHYHLLGDADYPLSEYLLTPYNNFGNLDAKKKQYNKKHSQTMVKIVNTFGLLKQRFRQLIRLDFYSVERMRKFVLACCVLHNMCIENGDLWEAETGSEVNPNKRNAYKLSLTQSNENDKKLSEVHLKHLGEIKRANIADNF